MEDPTDIASGTDTQQSKPDDEASDIDSIMDDSEKFATQEDEQKTLEHSEQPISDHREESGFDSEVVYGNEQETISHTIEEDFIQTPDVLDEVDTATVEATDESQQREDSSSLFIPEQILQHDHSSRTTPGQARTTSLIARPASAEMPPPPVPRQSVGRNSIFSRIRKLQTLNKQNKTTANQVSHPVLRQNPPTPDPESLLESLQRPRKQDKVPEKATVIDDADDDDDKADRAAAAEFRKQKAHYENLKLKNGGLLSFRQDVAWIHIQNAEDSRRRKRKRDENRARAELIDQGSSFDSADNSENNIDDSDDDDGRDSNTQTGSCKRRRPELPRKRPKRASMRDAEMKSMMVALEAHGDMPQKKKKAKQSESDDSQITTGSALKKGSKFKVSKPSKSKVSGKTSTKGPRKTAKEKKNAQHAVKQVASLFSSNVFEQQARQDAPDQPTFRSGKKQDALKELIASVPLENRRIVKGDMGAVIAASKDFDGRGSAKADGNGMWLVKGMTTSLKPYQLLGSAFMRRRENANEEPRGGLVADQMGLGKTLMALANIVNGRRPKNEKGPRTTLLVAGQNLLNQWAKEIETHTDGTLSVLQFRSSNRIESNKSLQILIEVLEGHDIVLTTYTEIMRSYPKNEPPITCQSVEDKISWWTDVYENMRGLFHRMMFQRIILDEAQAIKNHTSRTSIACRALMAEHRWALSGTPILNALTELYPYFKFLNVPHTGSFKIFKNNYCDSSDVENTERLLVRLSQFMIRRTHADEMFGAPILKLPTAAQATHWCRFNTVERNIYDIVQERFAKRINMWATTGELDKSYSNALVMLLRLRQLTSHVLMLQFVIRDLLEIEDIERIREVVKEAANNRSLNHHTIIAIRKQLDSLEASEIKKSTKKMKIAKRSDQGQDDRWPEDDAAPAVADDDDNEITDAETLTDDHEQADQVGSGKNFGKDFDFNPYLKSLTVGESWEKAKERSTCGSCGLQPVAALITSCQHLYCSSPCYEQMVIDAAESGEGERVMCKKCGQISRYTHPCDPDGELEDYPGPETRSGRKNHQYKYRVRLDREDIKDDWLSLGPGGSVLPSTKTIAIKAQIMNWVKENPKVKIIIYTQFLPMIRILARVCEEEGWPTEEYHGKLNFNARDKAVSSFADDSKIRVLLSSFRCGGNYENATDLSNAGLNLTMASRVIVLDPWWNDASEQQAFCRVFRIGQKETTFMMRFCVYNSVDERMIEMQEGKKKEINCIMEDGGKTARKMSIKDLMRLFGNLDEDHVGRPFIIVNSDPKGSFKADKDDEGFAADE